MAGTVLLCNACDRCTKHTVFSLGSAITPHNAELAPFKNDVGFFTVLLHTSLSALGESGVIFILFTPGMLSSIAWIVVRHLPALSAHFNGFGMDLRLQSQDLHHDFDLLVADSKDQASIDEFVGKAQVVMALAGPFMNYSKGVVDACVR